MQIVILILVAIAGIVIGRKTAKSFRTRGLPFSARKPEEMDKIRKIARKALSDRTEKRKKRILNFMDTESIHQEELKACGVDDLKKGVTSANMLRSTTKTGTKPYMVT